MGDPHPIYRGHEPRSADEEALALIRELGEIILASGGSWGFRSGGQARHLGAAVSRKSRK